MRHGEELLVEGADQHRGPLAEVHDLVEGALGGVDVGAAALLLDPGDARADDLDAALLAEHAGVLEHALVVGRGRDDVLALAEHAVSAGGVAAGHIAVGHGHDLGAKERADPADGAHEGHVLGTQRWLR